MAYNAYLRLTGETQGDIIGPAIQREREGSLIVISVNHEVTSSIDARSGMPDGRHQHRPLVITKEIDNASPLLMNALVNGEKITHFMLDFYRRTPDNEEIPFYTIELVDASIGSIRFEMLNNKYPENTQHNEREHVSFFYREIKWTFQDGGITAEARR